MEKKYWKDVLKEYKNSFFELEAEGLHYYIKASEVIIYTNVNEAKQLVGVSYNNGYLVFPTYTDAKSEESVNEVKSLDELLKCMSDFKVETAKKIPISKRIYDCLKNYVRDFENC